MTIRVEILACVSRSTIRSFIANVQLISLVNAVKLPFLIHAKAKAVVSLVNVKTSKVLHSVNVMMEYILMVLHVKIHAVILPVVLVFARQEQTQLINRTVRVRSIVLVTDVNFPEIYVETEPVAVAAIASRTMPYHVAIHAYVKAVLRKLIRVHFLIQNVRLKIVETMAFVWRLMVSS